LGALDNQRMFELGQRGENAKYEAIIGGRGVELCTPLPGSFEQIGR
jgi:hypothetical protein